MEEKTPNVLDPIEFGDSLLGNCANLIRRYDEWNENVRSLHEQNSHLYLREIRIREPPSARRRYHGRFHHNDREFNPPIDPLPVTLEHVNYEFQYQWAIVPPPEAVQFQTTKTISYYKKQRKDLKPDPNISVNQIRLHGPDETTPHVNPIPNSSSNVGSIDTDRVLRKRNLRMRDTAFKTAQSARSDYGLKLPNDLKHLSYKPPPRSPRFPRVKAIKDHEEAKLHVDKMQKSIEENLALSSRRIRRKNHELVRRKHQQQNPF